jgi:hypothetical protein
MFTPSQAALTGPQSYKEDGGEELLYTSAPQKELGEFADSLGKTPERYAALGILKFGLTFASLSSSSLLAVSTCIPSSRAAARRTDRNWSRSASDGSGTSKAATVLALSGCGAPHPAKTAQIARVTIQRMPAQLYSHTFAVRLTLSGCNRQMIPRARCEMEHEAGVEPACFGFKAQRGCRQPTTRVWIRRQESDLRGLRSERSWDASNPHLNDLAGRQGIEPCRPVLETSLLPEDNPNWRRAVSLSHMPRAARSAFQTAPGPCRVHAPELAEGGRSRSTHP